MNPTFRSSLLRSALLTSTIATAPAAEISFNTTALTTAEVTTPANWVGGVAPGPADTAAWLTDVDLATTGNQESRGGTVTLSSPVSWLGFRHEDSVGALTLTGSDITLGASGITEVRWELLTIRNNIILGAAQPWTNTTASTVSGTVSGPFGITKAGTGVLTLSGNNTYTGPTSINNGTIAATTLNRVAGGSATSSLGAPATVADGTLSMGTTTQGILSYLGAGETTDRVINLAGTTGGATISHAGGGLLSFTSAPTATGAGAKGVTLTGGGNGQIPGFPSNGGLTNLTKTGTGTWTLTGASSQTGGAVNVNGGTLAYGPAASRTSGTFTRNSFGGVLKLASSANVVTSNANINGILPAWVTVDDNTWAVANGAAAITGLAAAGYTADTWGSGLQTNVTATGADPAPDSLTNSLRFAAPAAKTVTLSGNAKILTGGVLVTAAVGANNTTITGAPGTSLVASNPPANTFGLAVGDFFFHQQNPAGLLTVDVPIINNSDAAPAPRVGTVGTTTAVNALGTTADLAIGMTVTGTGVPANATITAINSATQITLSAATTVAGTPTLTFGRVLNNGFVKTGPGTLILNGVNTYTGPTGVFEGTLEVNAATGGKIYNVSNSATLRLAYPIPNSTYNHGVNLTGAGLTAETGLYLKGGLNYTFQSGINVAGPPTTVRAYEAEFGPAILNGWDSNGTHISIPATASGTVFDANINFAPGAFGFVMNTTPGANTATGDLVLEGLLTGVPNANATKFRKTGAGSLRLTGASTNSNPLDIQAGSVLLSGGPDRIGPGAPVVLGNGTGSGKLVLLGHDQTLTNLTTAGTGPANAVTGGSPVLSILTINYAGPGQAFAGLIGGTGPDDNNIAFAKTGPGAYTLTGANSYTGGTTVSAGILGLGSASAAGPAGTITLAGGTLQFSAANTTDYTLAGRLRLQDGTTSSIDTNGQTITFANPFLTGMDGSGGLGKTGSGTLSLTAAQTFTGPARLAGGMLVLDYSTANASKLSNSASLELAGGTLTLTGGSHLEVVAETLVTGNTSITRTSGTAVISLGNLARTGTATLDIAAAGTARTTVANDATGKLPAWITLGGAPAANDGSGNVVAFSGFADIARLGGRISNNPSANVRIVDGGTSGDITPLLSGTTDISSILQNATGGPAVVSLGNTDVLRLAATGSLIVPASSGSLSMTGGSLTAGGAADTLGEIAIDADAPITLSGPVTDNGSGAVTLTKDGDGPLTLEAANLYSGGTTLTAGELRLGNAAALGYGPLTINGGSLDNTTGAPLTIFDPVPQFWNANVVFTGSNELFFDQSTATLGADRTVTVFNSLLGIGGPVSGAFRLTKEGPGTLVVRNAAWTGGSTVNSGILEVLGRSGGDDTYTVNPGATLQLGYITGGGYANTNLKINGSGILADTGLYLKAGASYNASGVIELLTAPTTIRSYGEGTADIGMFDINGNGINVAAVASGSVIAQGINFVSRGFGMSLTTAPGTATATGDLVMNGSLNIAAAGFGLYKRGTGSLALNGPATSANTGLKILGGTVFTGTDNAIGENADLLVSAGTSLVLNGYSQSAATLSGAGTIRNGVALPVTLTIRQLTDQTFTGRLGGAGTDDNTFSFVKSGPARLALDGVHTYAGDTALLEGILALSAPSLADTSDVIIAAGATLELNTGATDTIDQLIIDGSALPAGVYGAVGSTAPLQRGELTGTGTLTVTTGPITGGYAAWETANGITGAGPATDSDSDGIPNGIEFVIGGDPSGPGSESSALLPTATSDGTYLNFVFRRSAASLSANPVVQYGSALTGWTTAVNGSPTATPVIISQETDGFGPAIDRVTVRLPLALATPDSKFFTRLKFTIPVP